MLATTHHQPQCERAMTTTASNNISAQHKHVPPDSCRIRVAHLYAHISIINMKTLSLAPMIAHSHYNTPAIAKVSFPLWLAWNFKPQRKVFRIFFNSWSANWAHNQKSAWSMTKIELSSLRQSGSSMRLRENTSRLWAMQQVVECFPRNKFTNTHLNVSVHWFI